VALLAVPSAHTSALYGALDIFSTAGVRLVGSGVDGAPGLDTLIVAASGEPVPGWHGVPIQPGAAVSEAGDFDAVFIPSLGEPTGDMPPHDESVLDWLRQQHAAGAVIAAACSGVAVPAAAGLLEGQAATSHWAYAGELRRRYPGIRLQVERALVPSGDGHRLVTAGGGSLWTELVLYLIARLLGQEAAVASSKLYLVDWSRDSQLPYACLEEQLQHSDAKVRAAQKFIGEHLTESDVPARAREASGLAQRTFERRFRAAAGVTPLRYMQQLRVEYAKELLERTDRPAEDIADAVGYSDPGSFRRLFARLVGVTPAQYRRRFGGRWT
jgi:transcriptional regulator GlxA family with amidase domain